MFYLSVYTTGDVHISVVFMHTCVPWYVGKWMEHWEYSEFHKVITKKKGYEENVGSGEECDGAKGFWNFVKKMFCVAYFYLYV